MEIKKFKLMIKTHNFTGLKYLCITKKKNYESYLGSGKDWIAHLSIYGTDISTEILYSSDNYKEFLEMCYYYSFLYNVDKNPEFANIILETGYDTSLDDEEVYGLNNFEIFWSNADEETKEEIFKRRAETLRKTHLANVPETRDHFLELMKISAAKRFEDMDLDERRKYTEKWREGYRVWFDNITDNDLLEYKQKLSNAHKTRWENLSEEDKLEYGKMISERRKNLSEEKKIIRREKIRALHKNGHFDDMYKQMSENRKGLGNPAAIKVTWLGKEYSSGEFKALKIPKNVSEEYFLTRDDCIPPEKRIRTYTIYKCPYCNKCSSVDKSPGTFKRWHMENCKEKDKM